MSKAFSRVARVGLLALVVSFAPSASAGGKPVQASQDVAEPSSPAVSRATLLAVRETAAPAEIQAWVDEAIRAHAVAEEDRRVAKAIEAQAEKLSAGRFVWRPERATSGPVEIVVSIRAQRAYVFRDRKLIAVTTVSTGRRGNATPTGRFPILEKRREHFSNLYNNAPMPNMQRLTWDGVALHAGAVMPYAASHGCVRLPLEFSKLLFGVTSVGSVVHVIAGTPSSAMAALDQVTQTQMAEASGGGSRARTR
jgi:lipoprotein-anchoring transpeptidase ErfK/SrfK